MERFISSKPSISLSDIVDNIENYVSCCGNNYIKCMSSPKTRYEHLLASELRQLLNPKHLNNRIMLTNIIHNISKRDCPEKVIYPTAPSRILDAPGLINDFYIRILDWNKYNILAISLGSSVYLWNANTASVLQLTTVKSGYVSSIKWINTPGHHVLALGLSDGSIQLWDTSIPKLLRTIKNDNITQKNSNDQKRISSISWYSYILSFGNRSGQIHHTDVRSSKKFIAIQESAHKQDVCGLVWSPDGKHLASGGNDNIVKIWDDLTYTYPLHIIKDHTAAVKAMAWNPNHRRVLATGGGRSDQTLKLWSTTHGECIKSIDTDAQVTDLLWSSYEGTNDIITTHGYTSDHIKIWHGSLLTKKAKITEEYGRVISMASSPDGKVIATISSDENLRFWDIASNISTTPSTPKILRTPKQPNNTPLHNSNTSFLCSPLYSPPSHLHI